jgi:GAF domain-containing protein
VADPGELPVLLERAAGAIDASGLIVWVADRPGTSLFPILAQGYPASVLARMGSISRGADNAAADAFRHGELRTVAAHGSMPGAIVAPIITGDGCVGVLAAEMRRGAERDEATQAIAAILAAQLATFVTALPSPSTVEG